MIKFKKSTSLRKQAMSEYLPLKRSPVMQFAHVETLHLFAPNPTRLSLSLGALPSLQVNCLPTIHQLVSTNSVFSFAVSWPPVLFLVELGAAIKVASMTVPS
jgi:hypothetical protein